jgi:glycosyltransferase involved in cell wall biosynthesis
VKHAFVVPRYGREVPGGAEQGARLLAEHLVAELGWQVEIFTTRALDSRTWAEHYPPGTTEESGVVVHRFTSVSGRAPDFDRRSAALLRSPSTAPREDQEEWLRLQGPYCPAAVEAALASDAEHIAGYPYLYSPIIEAVRRSGRRSVLHPAAHDEAPLYLRVFDEVFAATGGLVLHTEAEARLVERRFPDSVALPQIVLGLGVDDPVVVDESVARDALGLGDRPFLVCVGRVDRTKGSDLLVRYFCEYKRRNPGPLALVLLGQVVNPPEPRDDIFTPGVVSDELKWSALRGASVLVTPSTNESFSLVVLEAWLAGTPVLVNAACGATVEHSRLSGGGLWFGGYGDFEVMVDRLVGDASLGAALAAAGGRYVAERFRWPVLVRRYAAFLGAPVMDGDAERTA